jgi:1-deoxy-D-xylulose 5-phosphate reductoisomerase
MKKRQLAILGSTGSIGTQALEVVSEHSDLFEVYALTANNQVDLLINQARKYMPEVVVIANERKYPELKEALEDLPIKVWAGADAIAQMVQSEPIDMVLTAMVGYSGLRPTISAIKAGKAIALANKETLVVAGELIMKLAAEHKVPILPVDSEHSAIFQCLTGAYDNPIEKILLTASRGAPPPGKGGGGGAGGAGYRDEGAGLEASELDDGGEDHDRLGLDDEQGLRDDRGEMVVRCHAGSGTGGGAPTVGDPLDGAV